MATYPEQIEVAKSFRLREGQHRRVDCPFCGGRNTYGVALRSGELRWGCFRASCTVHGRLSEGMSIDGLKARVQPSQGPVEGPQLLPIPVLSSVETQPHAMAFLERYHVLPAHRAGLVTVRYSPTEDRVMFPVDKSGYTGRARKGVKPKWKKYGDCTKLFTCGIGETAVVVEDALSACAVGIIPEYTGCALLGTTLSPEHIISLRGYKRVLVALDPDAIGKNVAMAGRIGSHASVRLIEDDLKEFEPDEILRQLNA